MPRGWYKSKQWNEMNIKTNSEVDKEILISCAFRYALGRRTYVVGSVVETILANWDHLSSQTKVRFVQEIREHKKQWGDVGMECDEREWQKIIDKLEEPNGQSTKSST